MVPTLSIIMPSYNDPRIGEAIDSVRRFDDIGAVRLVVIDGGSRPDTIAAITPRLRLGDVFVSERDDGIFDALNKGLDRVDTPYIGWLGSDDRYSGRVRASEVTAALATADLFVTTLAVFRDDRVRRITHAWPSGHNLARFGLHNPHYATFGATALLTSRRFDPQLIGADIAYFLGIFAQRPRVATTGKIGVLMREGGFSSASRMKVIAINRELFGVYRRAGGAVSAAAALAIKLGYKLGSLVQHSMLARPISTIEVAPGAADGGGR